MSAVSEIIDRYAAKITGTLGVGFRDFDTGEEYYVNGDTVFPAASTFKVPILISLFEQAEKGNLSLDGLHALDKEDRAIGSGVLALLTPGIKLPLRDYATLMMVISDNTGTDVIYNTLGADTIRATIQSMGLKETRCDISCDALVRLTYGIPMDISSQEALRRIQEEGYLPDPALYENMAAPNDVSSPRDMITMFSLIYRRQIVSKTACDEMMAIMERCQTNSRIPCHLPDKGPLKAKIAHKTGSLFTVANDSGVISAAGRTYALSMFCFGYHATEEEKTQIRENNLYDTLLADLSRDIFYAIHQ